MNGCCGTCKYGHYDKMQGYKELKKQQSLSVHTWMKLFLKWKKLKKRK